MPKHYKTEPTAREKLNAMVEFRRAKMDEPSIRLEDGTMIPKHAISQIVPRIERADAEARLDFAFHVMFGDKLETPAAKALGREIQYKGGNALWDKTVTNIMSVCVEVTTDKQIIFNAERVMEHLQPEERAAMRYKAAQDAGIREIMESRDAYDRQRAAASKISEPA